jgi:hypothetical protein
VALISLIAVGIAAIGGAALLSLAAEPAARSAMQEPVTLPQPSRPAPVINAASRNEVAPAEPRPARETVLVRAPAEPHGTTSVPALVLPSFATPEAELGFLQGRLPGESLTLEGLLGSEAALMRVLATDTAAELANHSELTERRVALSKKIAAQRARVGEIESRILVLQGAPGSN